MAKGQKPDYNMKLPVEGVWHKLGAAWKSKEGDTINIDVDRCAIDIEIHAEDLIRRLKNWKAPELRYTWGVFAKYCALVRSASEGAVTSR